MTTFNTRNARIVLAFLDAHPELPALCSVTHDASAAVFDSRVHHTLHLAERAAIRELLAWHDLLTDARVVAWDYPDPGRVNMHVYGLLPTGQGGDVYGGIYGTERDLLLLNVMGAEAKEITVDVAVLRRLSDARVAEAVA